jgi:hypothetical protein
MWAIGLGLLIKKKMQATQKDKTNNAPSVANAMNIKGVTKMLGGFTVLRMTSMLGMMNVTLTKEELLKINKKLNRIRKPKGVK